MKKTVLLLTIVGAAILMAGCGYINGNEAREQDPEKKQPSLKQEKTVVVNKGMSKKEEKVLQKRLDDLEKKVDKANEQTGNKPLPNPRRSKACHRRARGS